MIASDSLPTPEGDLLIQPINHASLMLRIGALVVYCDPVGPPSRYRDLPPPGLVLLTHEHNDHCDPATLAELAGEQTRILGAEVAITRLGDTGMRQADVLRHGDRRDLPGISIDVLPAHNLSPEKLGFHPPGVGNGYVLGMGGKRIYIPGDTEDHEQMLALREIDVAFLPMNTYTMTGDQAAAAAKAFRPRVVYPFHYLHNQEHLAFAAAMADAPEIEVRMRDWYAPS